MAHLAALMSKVVVGKIYSNWFIKPNQFESIWLANRLDSAVIEYIYYISGEWQYLQFPFRTPFHFALSRKKNYQYTVVKLAW